MADSASNSPDTGARSLRFDHVPTGDGGKVRLSVYEGTDCIFTDKIDPSSSLSRTTFLNRLAKKRPGIDTDRVDQYLIELSATLESEPDEQPTPPASSREDLLVARDLKIQELLASDPPNVRREAEELLLDPMLINRVLTDIEAAGVVGEQILALTVYMLGTSRLLDKPVSAITQGLTSSGKSYVQECVASLLPPEQVLLATDLTTNALYYMPLGALMHTFVVAGERARRDDDEHAQATKALREMISSGELRKVVPIKGPDGKMTSQVLYQPGPIAFIESTTIVKIFDEDANRMLLLGTDESQAQTARIVQAQGVRAAGNLARPNGILALHHALQRSLVRCRVRLPFGPQLAACIPTARQDARRAMPNIISMVQAIALLHQRQRATGPFQHGMTIEATLTDYAVARKLLVGPMARGLGGGLPAAVIGFAHRLIESMGDAAFTSSDVTRSESLVNSKSKINEYLRVLADAGTVDCVEPSRGTKPSTWKVVGPVPEAGAEWLPTVSQLQGGTP